jgi:hypothetical protein
MLDSIRLKTQILLARQTQVCQKRRKGETMQIENLSDVSAAYQCLALEMNQLGYVEYEHLAKLDILIDCAKQLRVKDDWEPVKYKIVGVLMCTRRQLKKAIEVAQ